MASKKDVAEHNTKGEVLVAILNNKPDFAILQEQLWYRIPVNYKPKHWPPQWVAFYHTKVFEQAAYTVQHYGRVRDIRQVKRRELFPNEFTNPKSEQEYHQGEGLMSRVFYTSSSGVEQQLALFEDGPEYEVD